MNIVRRIINFRYLKFIPIIIIAFILIVIFLSLIDKNTEKLDKINRQTDSLFLETQLPKFEVYLNSSKDKLGQEIIFSDQSLISGKKGGAINFFASWCVPCIIEHPILMELSKKGIDIYGIVFNDTERNIAEYLLRYGNPYKSYGFDIANEVFVSFGLTGVPQTYIFDKNGKIVYSFAGPLTDEIVETKILPLFPDL